MCLFPVSYLTHKNDNYKATKWTKRHVSDESYLQTSKSSAMSNSSLRSTICFRLLMHIMHASNRDHFGLNPELKIRQVAGGPFYPSF